MLVRNRIFPSLKNCHLIRNGSGGKRLLSKNPQSSQADFGAGIPINNVQNGNRQEEATTSFGYEQVPPNEKAQRVHLVFSNVAATYDLMNDVMSAGLHRLWKDYFVGKRLRLGRDSQVLDVAGGTGDIAFRVLERLRQRPRGHAKVTVFDINQKMLDVGQFRAKTDARLVEEMADGRLQWVCGDAEELPFPDTQFDVYTIAFGIRNCTNRQKVLAEALRVLRPGGQFACLEFSHVENPVIRRLYDAYSFQLIPVLGQLIAADFKSYKYLVESIRMFPDQHNFGVEIERAGFERVSYENLNFGVCAIHLGRKPREDIIIGEEEKVQNSGESSI